MMRLFSEQVKHTSTNSPLNIIQVENFDEIFFGVYEIELNKNKYPVEKVSEHNGNPVVSLPIVVEGVKTYYPFVLIKGKTEVLFNKNNTMDKMVANFEAIEETISTPILEKVELSLPVYEKVEIRPIVDNKKELLEQIDKAKRNAKREIVKFREQNLRQVAEESDKKEELLHEILEQARGTLVDEFVTISENIKSELVDVNDERYSEIVETVDNKIKDLADSLSESLKKDFNTSSKQFDNTIRKLVKELYTSSIIPRVDKELHNIAQDIVEKVSIIDKSLNDKLDTKLDASLLEGLNSEISSIRDSNIELNDNINRGVNKALSRVGNVNTKVDELTIALSEEVESKITQIGSKISQVEENINNYYTEKLRMLEEKTFDVTEETRKYIIGLVQESKDNLILEIRKIKNEKPIEYIIESKNSTPQIINEDKLVKDFDKKINTKIDNEVTRLRKYIAVYSGGGSVAMQFAAGGIMNGSLQINDNLTVLGTISASQYLGIPTGGTADALPLSGGTLTGGLTGTNAVFQTISAAQYLGLVIPNPDLSQYLPLSGGTINGNLTITGILSATLLNALSANITVLDIKTYEISGFTATGNLTVQGTISSNSVVYALSGNSNQWNNAYTSYNAASGNYAVKNANNFFSTTQTVQGDLSATGNLIVGANNIASGLYSSVAGGAVNTASGCYSNVAGGQNNTACGYFSTVAGGYSNCASGGYSNVAGGQSNAACGYFSNVAGGQSNTANGYNSTVAGGCNNTASGYFSNVAGGYNNTASGYCYANVGGGQGNCASGYNSTVAGGCNNTASGWYSFVGGGWCNEASGYCSSVVGGTTNTASGCYSNVAGGQNNCASGCWSNVAGGQSNTVSANYSGIFGGMDNHISHEHSFTIGSNLTSCATHTLYTENIVTTGNVTTNTLSAGNIKTVNSNSLFGYGDVYIPNLVWKGTYNNSTSYAINDGVFYNGSSYICVTAGTGNLPSNITFWSLLASQGLQGTTGASGAFSVPFTNVTSVTATHNFNAYPVIQLIDNSSPPAVLVPSSITHPSTNSSVITFALSTTGTVLCTLGGSSVTGYLPLTGGTMTGGISSNSSATFSNILVTAIPSTTDYDALLIVGSSPNSVFQSIQNASPGVSASTDFSVYNDAGQYLDMGIASSTFNGNLYSPKFNIVGAGDSYLYTTASDLMIGTALSSNTFTNDIVMFTGGTLSGSAAVGGNERMRITTAGLVGIGTTTPNQILTVVGNISSNSVIYSNNGNSNQWNSTYTGYSSTSAANASVNTTFINLSSGWQNTYTTVQANSASWSKSSVIAGYKEVSTAYTILSSDYTINCTANTFTVQLPTAVNKVGQIFNIKNSGTGTTTVSGFGAETIDGANTMVIGTRYNSMTIQSTNANWIII